MKRHGMFTDHHQGKPVTIAMPMADGAWVEWKDAEQLVSECEVDNNVTQLGRIKLIFDTLSDPSNWIDGKWNGSIHLHSWIKQGKECVDTLSELSK